MSAVHANFGHILAVRSEDMLRFIVDHIDCWRRRPAFAEHGPVINLLDDVDADDWFTTDTSLLPLTVNCINLFDCFDSFDALSVILLTIACSNMLLGIIYL